MRLEFVDSLILENIYYGKLTDQLIDNYDTQDLSLDNEYFYLLLVKIIKGMIWIKKTSSQTY